MKNELTRKKQKIIITEKFVCQKEKREGKSPSTQAGEFVHEEIEHIRKGKHGARNTKQAIAIGLSKARRSGVDLPSNPEKASNKSEKDTRGRIAKRKTSAKKTHAAEPRLQKEPKSSVSHKALSTQAKSAAKKRSSADRHASAMKGVRTKGKNGLKKAGKKAAKTKEYNQKAA